jgi:drug/metabolite transporter (DMT)-like permease
VSVRRPSDAWLAYAALAFLMLLWSSNAVLGRYAVHDFPPIALTYGRWIVAVAVLAPFGLRELVRQRALLVAHWKIILLLATLGTTAFNALYYVALLSTTAVNASLINGSTPAAIVFVSWLVARDRITWRTAFGMMVAFVGLVVIILRGALDSLVDFDVNRGDTLVVLAVCCWALYSALLRHRPPGLGAIAFALLATLVGMVVLAPFYAWERSLGKTFELTWSNLLVVLYAGAFLSALTSVLWIRSVTVVGANTAGQFSYLLPVFGSVLAVVLLGEDFQLYHLFGMALVLGGVYLAVGRRAGPTGGRASAR